MREEEEVAKHGGGRAANCGGGGCGGVREAEEAGTRRAEEPSGTGAWGGAGEREPGRRGFGRLRSRDHDQMAEMQWQTQGRERADSLCSF